MNEYPPYRGQEKQAIGIIGPKFEGYIEVLLERVSVERNHDVGVQLVAELQGSVLYRVLRGGHARVDHLGGGREGEEAGR